MTKVILCEGCSWTAGDMINPELKLAGEEHPYVNHPKMTITDYQKYGHISWVKN